MVPAALVSHEPPPALRPVVAIILRDFARDYRKRAGRNGAPSVLADDLLAYADRLMLPEGDGVDRRRQKWRDKKRRQRARARQNAA